jgi:CheY-like chemotaxis protein
MTAAETSLTPPAGLPSKHVLVVEDEPLLRVLIADELRDRGYDVCEAANADAALSMLGAADPFDLLLTDLQMPGGTDGLCLAERVRSHWPQIKIIIFSGNPPAAGPNAVADLVLKKPLDFTFLLDSVGCLLH